jgi:hypothetical protein
MIVFLMVTYYLAHRIAHRIVTEYGFLGGLDYLRRNLRYQPNHAPSRHVMDLGLAVVVVENYGIPAGLAALVIIYRFGVIMERL